MFRDAISKDKELFLTMAEKFYSSSAVLNCIDIKNFETTFDLAMNKSPFVRIVIVESENTPIGYAQLSLTYSMEAGGMVVLIEDVYIDEAHRSDGYGSKLLHFIENQYPTFKRFRLEVMKHNKKAINLFKKIGYTELEYVQMVKDF